MDPGVVGGLAPAVVAPTGFELPQGVGTGRGPGAQSVAEALKAAGGQPLSGGPRYGWGDIPADVRAMIQTSQHESAMAILDTWAKSIAEQAKLDKEAAARSDKNKANENRVDLGRSRALLARSVTRLENLGVVTPAEAQHLRQTADLATQSAHEPGPSSARPGSITLNLIAGLAAPGGRSGINT